MNLYEKILYLCPSLKNEDFYTTIVLRNDGDVRGDYIAQWDHPTVPQPTEQQFASIDVAAYEAEKTYNTYVSTYSNAIQEHIDKTAMSKDYANGISLASYDSSTNQVWASEAQAFISWRDNVWTYAYTELEKVKNGQRPQPTIEQILSELPQIVWPQ